MSRELAERQAPICSYHRTPLAFDGQCDHCVDEDRSDGAVEADWWTEYVR